MTAQPRLLFMAKPQPEVLSAMVTAVTSHGLDTLLGAALFAPENWHQSLSLRYASKPELCEKLLRAGSRISAAPFTMTLDHIASGSGDSSRMHWAFRAHSKPKGFQKLLKAIQDALLTEGLDEAQQHSPHATISYWAPSPLPSIVMDTPIDWTIDEILLVEGGGKEPYRYRTLGRWPLVIPPYPYAQLRLL